MWCSAPRRGCRSEAMRKRSNLSRSLSELGARCLPIYSQDVAIMTVALLCSVMMDRLTSEARATFDPAKLEPMTTRAGEFISTSHSVRVTTWIRYGLVNQAIVVRKRPFSIEPVLLVGKSKPRGFHALETLLSRFILHVLRLISTTLCVVPEYLRLLPVHDFLLSLVWAAPHWSGVLGPDLAKKTITSARRRAPR